MIFLFIPSLKKMSLHRLKNSDLFYKYNGFKLELDDKPMNIIEDIKEVFSKDPIQDINQKVLNDKIQGKSIHSTFFSNDLAPQSQSTTGIKNEYLFENIFQRLIKDYTIIPGNIKSFNNWLINILPKQIRDKAEYHDGHKFYFDDIIYLKPIVPDTNLKVPLFPTKARTDNYTYSFTIYANGYKENPETGERTLINQYEKITSIPAMVGSVVCHLNHYNPSMKLSVFEDPMDPLGYFIKEGNEKVVVIIENLQREKFLTYYLKDKSVLNTVTPVQNEDDYDPSGMAVANDNPEDEDEDIPDEILTTPDSLSNAIDNQNTGGLPKISVNSKNVHTSTTLYTPSGTIRLNIISHPDYPSFLISISPKGHKGSPSDNYPILLIFDVLLQLYNPEIYMYEHTYLEKSDLNQFKDFYIQNKDNTSLVSNIPKKEANRSDRDYKRKLIIQSFFEILKSYTLSDNNFNILENSMKISIAHYTTIPNPIEYVVKNKYSNFITDKKKSSEIYLEELKKSDLSKILEFITDLFPSASLQTKPQSFVRFVWQHLACVNSLRAFDNRDSWSQKMVKMPYESLSGIFNNSFKFTVQPKKSNQSINSLSGITSSKSKKLIKKQLIKGLEENLIEAENDMDNDVVTHILSINKDEIKDKFEKSLGSAGFEDRPDTVESMKRKNQIGPIQNITKLNPNVTKRVRQLTIRYIQPTQIGYVCIYDTPSGNSCGIKKNLSCMVNVSVNRYYLVEYKQLVLDTMSKFSVRAMDTHSYTVILNTEVLGYVSSSFEDAIRRVTKTNLNYYDIEIITSPEEKYIKIITIGGNLVRPLLTVDQSSGELILNKVLPKLKKETFEVSIEDLIENGCIEFITPAEQERSVIAQSYSYIKTIIDNRKDNPGYGIFNTRKLPIYCEVDPIALFSTQAALMSYQNTCQGPRITYQTKMFTQAISKYHPYYYNRYDTSFKQAEVQRSFIETIYSKPIGISLNPYGKVMWVAIAALGNNAEDGICVSYDAIQNYKIKKYSTFKYVLESVNTSNENGKNFVREYLSEPDYVVNGKPLLPNQIETYKNIEKSGLPRIGSLIQTGYCIICKKRQTSAGIEDISEFAKISENGIVERILITEKRSGNTTYTHIKIKVRNNLQLMIGDKLASTYSQKGTITGLRSITDNLVNMPQADISDPRVLENKLYTPSEEDSDSDEEDSDGVTTNTIQNTAFRTMPMIASGPFKGLTPTIMINPHGQPTRMTAGMLIEMIASKAALFTGERIDGSAFKTPSYDQIQKWCDVLEENGCDRNGFEEVVHTLNGNTYKTKIFIAPCYYQTLKSVRIDTFQYRATGKPNKKTKQPITGRDLGGAMKNGEMEKSAISTWGAASLLLERFKFSSDQHLYEICRTCGNQARVNYRNNTVACDVCSTPDKNVAIANVCFSSILINRILMGFGIQSTFNRTNVMMDGYEEV